MSTLAQRRVILWRNFYQSLSLKIVKISTPRKKLVARSRIWNSMILTSLNIVLWPGHIESWPHGAFFISAIFGTVVSMSTASKIHYLEDFFLVCMERKRPEFLYESKFLVIWGHSTTLLSQNWIRAIMAPPCNNIISKPM